MAPGAGIAPEYLSVVTSPARLHFTFGMTRPLTIGCVAPDSCVFVTLRCYVMLNTALLGVQVWTFTQRAYIRQETEGRIWFAALLLGLALLVSSLLLKRRRRRLAVAGLVTSIPNILLALQWILVPRGAID